MIRVFFSQLFRFASVGTLAAIVNFSIVVWLVHFFNWHPLVANIAAFLVAFQVSFFGHRFWTFNHKQHTIGSLPKFFTVAVFSFLLNEGLYSVFLAFHIDYRLSLFFVIFIAAIFTLLLSKFWAFR